MKGKGRLQTISGPNRPPAILSPSLGPYLAVEETVEYRHEETLAWREKAVKGLGHVAPPSFWAAPFPPQPPAPQAPAWENAHPWRWGGGSQG